MAGQGGWTNELITSLILPTNAGPNDARLVLGPDIPTELVTYYSVATVTAAILGYADATHYQYRAYLYIAGTGEESLVEGWVSSGQVYEEMSYYLDPASGIPRTMAIGDFYGTRADGIQVFVTGVPTAPVGYALGTNVSSFDIGAGVDLTCTSVSQGRGITQIASSTGSSAAFAAEAISLTASNVVFKQYRTYRVEFGTQITASLATNTGQFRLRKTNLAGTVWGDAAAFGPSGAAANINSQGCFHIRRNVGSDLTATVVLTLAPSGGGTVTHVGSTTGPRYLLIRDVGAYADYPFAFTIT